MRKACLEGIYELARRDQRILFVGSDISSSGVLERFKTEMPDRFFMEGISEGHLLSMMAGFALCGKISYFNTIASFITRRCFEQIVLDACLHRFRIRLIGSGGGVVYAPLGPTHQVIEDIAILRSLPHMTVLVPADADEMRRLLPQTVDYEGPIYIRLAKGGDPIVSREEFGFKIGAAYIYRPGNDVAIITTGIMLKAALDAAQNLETHGIQAAVVHVPTVKPLDCETVIQACRAVRLVVTVEEHTIIGGLGSAVAEILMETEGGSAKRLIRCGFPDVFPEGYGSQALLMKKYGLDSENIIRKILAVMQ